MRHSPAGTTLTFRVEEALEGGYTARALGQSIFTEADTLDALRFNIREAVNCHFDESHTLTVLYMI